MNQEENKVKPVDLATGNSSEASPIAQKPKFYRAFKTKESFENHLKNVVKNKDEALAEKDKKIEELNLKLEILTKIHTKNENSVSAFEKPEKPERPPYLL